MVKSKPVVPPDTPRVYSYLRYSTKEQALGDSERRQIEMTKAFALRQGLTLDESLRLADRGISAFRGKHRRKGALAAFLNEVESGQVPSGSYLVLENLDRLSREGFGSTLRKIIYRLWDRGIVLQTLSPEESYPPGCENDPKFIGLWLYLNRAHDESKLKSNRLKQVRESARQKARESGRILTCRCPAWLEPEYKLNAEGQRTWAKRFRIRPGAKSTIETIFKWKLSGIGVRMIALRLNREKGWWVPPKRKGQATNGWNSSYVRKILVSRSVLGEYQPHTKIDEMIDGEKIQVRQPVGDPIPGYFPRIIDDGTFLSVQQQLAANGGKPGTKGRAGGPVTTFANLFRGMVKCGYCHGPMYHIPKGGPGRPSDTYLCCDAGRRAAGCDKHSITYAEVERTVLENLIELKPEAVLPSSDEQSRRVESLQVTIQGNKAKVRDIQEQKQNLIDQIARTKNESIRDSYEAKFVQLEASEQDIERTIQQDERDLSKAETGSKSFARWQRDLKSLRKALADKGDVELRLRLHTHLRQIIDRIEVFTDGFLTEYDGDGHEPDELMRMFAGGKQAKWWTLTAEQQKELRKPKGADCAESISQYLPEVATEFDLMDTRTKEFREFVQYVVKRRMSKEGRFIRVFFASGCWSDFVPDGSIASGCRMYVREHGEPGMEFIRPDIGVLWEQFKRSRRKS